MLNSREQRTADYFGITEKVEALEQDLLKIHGVEAVEFDLDNFYDHMKYVIFLPKYNIPVSAPDYFAQRRELLKSVLETAKLHGLTRTEDSIEDYGEHFYIVCRCDWTPAKNWEA